MGEKVDWRDLLEAWEAEGYGPLISEWEASRLMARYGVVRLPGNRPRDKFVMLGDVARDFLRRTGW